MAAFAAGAAEYRRMIEKVAEHLRPRFESGELHGFRDEDEGAETTSIDKIEQVCRRLFPNLESAHLALACSPSRDLGDYGDVTVGREEQALWHATWAAGLDVVRLARERDWYRPTEDEIPSNAKLGVRS